MLNKIKNYFSEWNWFELSFIIIFEITFLVLGIVFKQPFLSSLYSMTILLCAFLLVKGKWYAYIFGLVGILTYCYISYQNRYWGEAIWHLIITTPLYITSLVTWLKNQQNKVVKIRKITPLEYVLFFLGFTGLFFGAMFLLKHFDTPQYLSSAFAITFSGMANYLAARRSNLTFVAYCLDDVFVIIIWLIPVINGEIGLLNVAITMFAFLINDLYGVYNWIRIRKKQLKYNQEMQENNNTPIKNNQILSDNNQDNK